MTDYYKVEKRRYQETQALVEKLRHHLITLATSFKGRLAPDEEDTLADLFHVQMELQTLLDEISPGQTQAPPFPPTASNNVNSIAHAQAMQYARDLVKALRQKREQQRHLELTSQQLIRAEKLATIGHVTAAVAHELGNIFTPLLMYAKLIYKETAGDKESEVAEYATHINEIANRASDMLRQLVDAARREPANMIPVDLRHVIQNALALLSPQARKQRIRIEQHFPGDPPLVMGRSDQLEQIFINIALNAFDAMPDGGDFTVTLEPGREENGSDDGVNLVTVHLKDTGIGIPPENVSLLFEPFFTTKERGAGTGLGLFVSHLIVDQHGGAIEVESEAGVGTTFIIKLPTVDRKSAEA